MRVSCSVPTNPPHPDRPVTLVVPTNVVFPRPVKWPVAVMWFEFCDVAMPLPEMLPLKGFEAVAKAAGSALDATRTRLRIVTVMITLFILF